MYKTNEGFDGMMYAQFTDLIEGLALLREARSSGLDIWEGIIMILFILKDIAIVGGILGVIVWYIKKHKSDEPCSYHGKPPLTNKELKKYKEKKWQT